MSERARRLRVHYSRHDERIAVACEQAARDLNQEVQLVLERSRARVSLSSQLIEIDPDEIITVVILSSHYLKNPFFRSEWLALVAAGYRMIPIVVGDFDASPYIGATIPLKLSTYPDSEWPQAIRDAISRRPSRETNRPSKPATVGDNPEQRPRVSNVQMRDNLDILAEQELIDALTQSFEMAEQAGTKIRAITGPAAVGKTSLAAAFVDRSRGRYETMWWLDASDISSIRRGLGDLGEALGLTKSFDSWATTIHRLRKWAESENEDWLIVFDDVSDAKVIEHLLPESAAGHVLITTRAIDLPSSIPRLDASALSPDAATQYLLDKVGTRDKKSRKMAARLAGLFQGKAFALREAAGWIRATGTSMGSYVLAITSIVDQARESWEWGSDALLRAATRLSLDAAQERVPSTRQVLLIASRLAENGVQIELLEEISSLSGRHVRRGLVSGVCYGLITMSDDFRVSMHPSVAFYIRDSESAEDSSRELRRLVDWFATNLPTVSAPVLELRGVRDKYFHAQRVLAHAAERALIYTPASRVAQTCGQLASLAGEPETAYRMYVLSEHFLPSKVRSTPRPQLVSGVLADTATAMKELGKGASGEHLLRWVLSRAPEGDVKNVARMNLASHLLESGHADEADSILTSLSQEVDPGVFHSDFLDASLRHNLSVLSGEQGDVEGAIGGLWDVVRERSTNLGLGHPATTRSRIALALFLGLSDTDSALASEILEDCLQLSSAYFGRNSPTVLESLDALTALSMSRLDYRAAIDWGSKAFSSRARSGDFASQGAVTSACHLSRALLETGRSKEALRVLSIIRDEAASAWIDQPELLEQLRSLKQAATEASSKISTSLTLAEGADLVLQSGRQRPSQNAYSWLDETRRDESEPEGG